MKGRTQTNYMQSKRHSTLQLRNVIGIAESRHQRVERKLIRRRHVTDARICQIATCRSSRLGIKLG